MDLGDRYSKLLTSVRLNIAACEVFRARCACYRVPNLSPRIQSLALEAFIQNAFWCRNSNAWVRVHNSKMRF